ncbi:MAG TPA: CoA activase, partial [Caldithrix sp.]|nr:CoA activase [Caldithrix sp.]
IKDEITAHKTGAEFLARTMLNTEPDTIFEIGGQDSKFISLQNGVVVDFAMNEACAAGTGSFLEERAEELGISIKEEFANLALSSRSPVKLGERCTVFMQQDVATFQQRGASREDLTAGLAYSIVYNYLNRVVRGRKIGEVIFFQGGTAYNNAIASAFARVLDKEIIVPPYNGVVGAVGAALLAKEKMLATRNVTKFRGFSLEKVNYHLREFTCKACSNFCHMQEFTVDGEKTYWGDQCSDKFRRKQQSEQKPVIPDLLKLRRELLFAEYEPDVQGKATIGLPRALYVYEQFPFWNTFFRHLGYRVVLSEETNHRLIRSGTEISVAEPCLPIQAYHGHVKELVDKQVNWIFIPNTINAETPFKEVNSYYCPWGQTIPFVIKNSEVFASISEKILSPSLRFRDGKNAIAHVLMKTFRSLGENKKNILRAVDAAYLAQNAFQHTLQKAGERALRMLRESGKIGIVLVGRPYNIYDRGMTLDIGNKLRDYYGINVIPMDFLPLDSVDISDVNMNMYWNYGRKIIAAAKIVSQFERLHIIYLTNFKCGPDSYIKHYITRASGKPFLTLQFDGHGNDAGYITRCEAYLDSKGALRVWTSGSDEAIRPKKIKSVVTV